MLIIISELENISTRRDRTWKLVFGTQELAPDQVAELSRAQNKAVYLALKIDEFKTAETEILESMESGYEERGKTQSQRIRAVLFKLYTQNNEGFTSFENYYQVKTEKYIEYLKGKIL